MIDLVNLYRGATLRWGDFGNDGLRWVFGRPPRKQTAKIFENTTRTQHTRGGGDKFSRNSGTETRRHYKSLILNTSERSNCAANVVITFERQLDQSFIQEYGRDRNAQSTNCSKQGF